MKTYVLATVGTSLLTNLRREMNLPPDKLPADQSAVALLRTKDPNDRLCGAEINSIANLLAGETLSAGTTRPPAGLQFLVSDTAEGQWCGRVLTLYFRHYRGVEEVAWEVVRDLTDADPRRFAHQGLRSLVKLAAKHLQRAQEREPTALRLIDATGGYKAQISFAGLIGQVLKVPVVYLFERFTHCIEMPPLPVDFDRSLWIEHYSLFRRLSEEPILPARDFYREDRESRLWPLLDHEQIDGEEYVSLSPILELMHQGFELVPPVGLEEPPASDLPPEAKLHLNRAEMAHAPAGSDQVALRLAQLPWVTRVENLRFVNTAVRSRVKPGGWALARVQYLPAGAGDAAMRGLCEGVATSAGGYFAGYGSGKHPPLPLERHGEGCAGRSQAGSLRRREGCGMGRIGPGFP